ncbi:energy transducer TonB [Cognatishimia sp.]|uniref:energy transducer TonB n=1 Tax=Cognatishimia sp. TaxID=2211648 RepID=UPI0035160467
MARTANALTLHLGHYVSGSAHMLLIGWVLFGGVFRSAPDPFEITGVEMISLQEFDALFAPENVPAPETVVETPVAPEVTETSPALSPTQDREIETVPVPEPTPTLPDPVPEIATPAPPPPLIVETPTPPELPSIEPPSSAPEQAVRPIARPVRRVAPTPVEAPDPDLQIDEIDQAPTAPSEDAAATEDAPDATAQEEAATEIPTEPQEVAAAPTTSLRPKIRPRAASPATPTQPAPEATTEDSVAAALAEAQEQAETPARPSGPPLSFAEKESLRVSVQQCWNVDVGSQAANVVVVLGMSLDRDGRVAGGTLRLLSATGGDERAQNAAFEAARRAVLRCQRGGFNLPIEKYEHWRDIEMTFNPEKMRRR